MKEGRREDMFRITAWIFFVGVVLIVLISDDTSLSKTNWNAVWLIVSGLLIVALAEIAAAIHSIGGKKEWF